MSNVRRISAPAGRKYESVIPKRQTTLITPRKTAKKYTTYGKSSSVKKTTLTQFWDWEKIINDETVKDEQNLASSKRDAIDEGQARRTNKRANNLANSNDYTGVNKRKSLRKSFANESCEDTDIPLKSKADGQNIETSPIKSIGHRSLADIYSPLHNRSLGQKLVIPEVFFDSRVIDNEKEVLPDKDLLAEDSTSSSQIIRPSTRDNSQSGLYRSLDSVSPIYKKKNVDIHPLPKTPKQLLALEVPSSQSPATPISIGSRGSVIFCRSLTKKLNNNPIAFKLKKKQFNCLEVMDTFAPDSDFSLTDNDTPKAACKNNNLNHEIQDTLDPETYFNPEAHDHSSRDKLISPSKSVKFFLLGEEEDEEINQTSIVNEESNRKTLLNKKNFQLKSEILDSEAESDEEVDFYDEINSKINTISGKIHEKIDPLESDLEHQNLLVKKIIEQTDTYYGETLGLETQLELEKIPSSYQASNISQKSVSSNVFPEVTKKKNVALYDETQFIENMRLSTQNLSQIAPRTSESDIFLSIDPQRVIEILNRVRNHETRRYKLPPPVCRVWLYERHPVCAVKYMAEISSPKFPGDIMNEDGKGNKEFNSRKSAGSWCAYEILQMYELSDPLTLEDLKSKEWLKKAPLPMKWTKIPPAVADELVANIKKPIFEDSIYPDAEGSPSRNTYDANTETLSNTNKSIPLGILNKPNISLPKEVEKIEVDLYPLQTKSEFKKEYPSSQATTVDLSPVNTPRQQSFEIICETPTQLEIARNTDILPSITPIEFSHDVNLRNPVPFSMASSQLLTESQLLPDSLLNDCTLMPEPILPSSEDFFYD
ncbi:hypothetical protein OnM2_027082 [Erysiphe neolycopersici]|uniref:Uncharacterized protein n=1 Tax=Erysiphe neolycopersici TaxID=212602 RepID=A0A420I0L3_9PEZI|nr:hypothetical protein OnM2_027082 [Erysiphe neolycopersici]